MTDRGESALRQTQDSLTVGPSEMRWQNDRLIVSINERSVPHGDVLSGSVEIEPTNITDIEIPLHEQGTHIWRPFAPSSKIRVNLNKAGWQWQGHGYFDANFGTAALEDDFSYWTWGRFPTSEGTTCFYDASRRDGSDDLAIALEFKYDGTVAEIEAPPIQQFETSLWRVRRETRCDLNHTPKQTKMMLDAPFYCRSGVETVINGEQSAGVHEALDLDRFANPFLKPMLAVKVPRRRNWAFKK